MGIVQNNSHSTVKVIEPAVVWQRSPLKFMERLARDQGFSVISTRKVVRMDNERSILQGLITLKDGNVI
jgi:CRP-like cAMP-binding protein